jgi:transcriptional regulator with XRE-family HTH domain
LLFPLTDGHSCIILGHMGRMTNEEFGDRVGITDSYASYLRNGRRMPSAHLLMRIIRAFQLDPITTWNAYEKGSDEFSKYLRREIFDKKEPEPARA